MKQSSNASIILREDLEKRWPGYVYEEYRFLTTRKFRFDYAVLGRLRQFGFEINGGIFAGKGGHSSIKGILRDMEKKNLATLNRWRVFEFTPQQIERSEHLFVLDALARGE